MNKAIIMLCCILFSSFTLAEENSCKVAGYTIGFFNGVMTSPKEAKNGLEHLQSTLGYSQYNGEEVNYQLFYNESGKEGYHGYGLLEDFAETFDQRTQELGQQSFDKWEGFWEIVNNRQNGAIIQKISSIISGFFDFVVSSVNTTINLAIREFLAFVATTPDTGEVRQHHQLIGDSLAWQGKKMLLIAHSQGNLWVNEAYQSILEKQGYDESAVKIVHIAPASPIINGDYILSDNDFVIKGLNVTSIGSGPKPNISAAFTKNDRLGHGLIEVYLRDSNTKPRIISAVNKAMVSLAKPEMEDYLFNITYKFSPNFVKYNYPPEFDLLNWSDSEDTIFCEGSNYVQDIDCYLAEEAWNMHHLKGKTHDLEIEQSSESQQEYSVAFLTCKDIEHVSYLWGHFSNPYDFANSDLDTFYNVSLTDRYGEKPANGYFANELVDISSSHPHRSLDVAGVGDFFNLGMATDNYTEVDKGYLKAQDLPIPYTLQVKNKWVSKLLLML